MDCSKYSLIDLHLHLDGSLTADSVLKMAEICGEELPSYDRNIIAGMLKCPEDCSDLNDYLKCFDLPLSVLQTEETIEYSVYDLLKRLSEQGLVGAEVRFAPQLHLQKGMTQLQVVQAAVRGAEKAEKETGIISGLLLCCMRGDSNKAENAETVRIAAKLKGDIVVGCDLAGAEALFPTEGFEDIFNIAVDNGVPFTIHAGEAAGTDEIYTAVSFGALRIGHGIRSFDSPATLKMLSENGITLELCPTSNLDTRALDGINSISDYPVKEFFRNNVKVTVNTDDMAVSGTTLEFEYRKLFEYGLITEAQAEETVYNAVNASFLPDGKKQRLIKIVSERLG